VPIVVEARAFAGLAEGCARTRARPNRPICWPTSELKGIVPSSDTGEEVTAVVAGEVCWLHVSDVSLIDTSGHDESGRDEFAEPSGGEAIVLVVVRTHRKSSSEARNARMRFAGFKPKPSTPMFSFTILLPPRFRPLESKPTMPSVAVVAQGTEPYPTQPFLPVAPHPIVAADLGDLVVAAVRVVDVKA